MFMTSSRYLSIYFEKLKKFPHIVAVRSELKVCNKQQKFNHIHMILFFKIQNKQWDLYCRAKQWPALPSSKKQYTVLPSSQTLSTLHKTSPSFLFNLRTLVQPIDILQPLSHHIHPLRIHSQQHTITSACAIVLFVFRAHPAQHECINKNKNEASGKRGLVLEKPRLLCVLYTPPSFLTDSNGLSPDPANSNGLSRQSIGLPMESIGLDQILLLVQSKSSQSLLKSS